MPRGLCLSGYAPSLFAELPADSVIPRFLRLPSFWSKNLIILTYMGYIWLRTSFFLKEMLKVINIKYYNVRIFTILKSPLQVFWTLKRDKLEFPTLVRERWRYQIGWKYNHSLLPAFGLWRQLDRVPMTTSGTVDNHSNKLFTGKYLWIQILRHIKTHNILTNPWHIDKHMTYWQKFNGQIPM